MPTTTNYGWTTPADTDLVKDGAAAIRTLGSGVDTTVKNLNPETTLGDISYRSSTANTNTRLAIGSTGNVLTVSGGVPVWAAPAGGGKVLQVVQGTTSTETTVASTTFTDSTLTASITPSAATSKVLVIVSQFCNFGKDDNDQGMSLKLLRGSTDIFQPAGTGGEVGRMYWISAYTTTSPKGTGGNNVISFSYLDSPATTSSTTYKTQQRVLSTASSGTCITQKASGTSSIILLEIGA